MPLIYRKVTRINLGAYKVYGIAVACVSEYVIRPPVRDIVPRELVTVGKGKNNKSCRKCNANADKYFFDRFGLYVGFFLLVFIKRHIFIADYITFGVFAFGVMSFEIFKHPFSLP